MNFKQTFPTPAEHSPGRNTCRYIVLHHTGTKEGTVQGVLNGLNKRADYASCHYLVDVNGDVYKMGNDTDILWHAGVSSWAGFTDLNKHSIGIETIGPMSDGGFTTAQRASVAKLIKHLCDTHRLDASRVVRHKDIAPGRKWDISDTFWNVVAKSWDEWKMRIFEKKLPPVAREAESAWKKAKLRGYVSDTTNPEEDVHSATLQWIFSKMQVMQQPTKETKQLQWYLVALDRLGVLD